MSSSRIAYSAFGQQALISRQVQTATLQQLRRQTLGLSRQNRAVALLIPRAYYATETSSSQQNRSDYPPPGFNVDQAKKSTEDVKETAADAKDKVKEGVKNTVDSLKEKVESAKASAEAETNAKEHPVTEGVSAETALESKSETEKKAVAEAKKKEDEKLTLWQKVKREAHHYWDGTKLLATEVRISSKLALKMAAGYELSRRENRQLERTVQDLARLVPFSVFVIVPFAELLLPVALKLFPNLLPSTYEGQKSKDKKASNLRSTRKDVSTFLRSTLKESGLPISIATTKKEEFTEFFRKVRATGEKPTEEDVVKVCKIFKDDLTLDNLSRPQLVGMCRYMNLNSFGTDAMLRYQIRHRMRQIKRDDRAIQYEGVSSLSVTELQSACASRGLRTHGLSPGRLRDDLQMWLNLRLKDGVPSTLLVLSNAYIYAQGKETELKTQIEALQAVLSSIPEELFHEIELEVHTAEGAATNKQRLEVLKEQEDLIEEENEQDEESGNSGNSPQDNENIDDEAKSSSNNANDAVAAQSAESKEAEQDETNAGKEEARRASEEKK